ncbi:crotonase/enoyl-CoA hydratase family protein [Millisia brevis]|uniref:crotonase/enoyl-CoA hydratase family protein n=1 Tax=Millisia brevis TaxID=264148 RepID=UPI0008337D40|nr:crotonase/enoyl-CoA hydratase family protein [Millisia brevis]
MTEATTTPAALTERHGHVLVVTINRPEARNAINGAVSSALGQALEDAEADPDIRAIVLTGSGDKAFCAGADLKAISRGENIYAPNNPEWGFAGFVRHFVNVPTIAAVNGAALGGGTEIALTADLVVAAESAVFGLPEVKRGLFAGAGGVFRLPQQIPRRLAMEMILTGDPITAEQALEYGLINRVVPDDQLLDAALELANRIAVNAPLSVQASKRVAYGAREGSVDETASWEDTGREWAALMQTEDFKEGPLAFAQKRAPVWKGR